MAQLNLVKKDLENIQTDRNLKICDVLKEARINHNELIDAITSMNNVLSEINKKLEDNPELARSIEFNAATIKNVE